MSDWHKRRRKWQARGRVTRPCGPQPTTTTAAGSTACAALTTTQPCLLSSVRPALLLPPLLSRWGMATATSIYIEGMRALQLSEYLLAHIKLVELETNARQQHLQQVESLDLCAIYGKPEFKALTSKGRPAGRHVKPQLRQCAQCPCQGPAALVPGIQL
eukprot:760226-Hanusia_phi.AAC.7